VPGYLPLLTDENVSGRDHVEAGTPLPAALFEKFAALLAS